MAPIAKRPAMQPAKRPRKEDDDIAEDFEKESMMKKPAGSVLKRPAGVATPDEPSDDGEESNKGNQDGGSSGEDDDDEAEAPSVMKKPGMALNKRPAAALVESEDGERSEEEADESEPPSVMKRPGMAGPSLAKRPAAAMEGSDAGEGSDQDEAEEAPPKPVTVSVDMLARQSANELRKKRSALERLQKVKEALAQKIKANGAAMRAIEKELEGTEAEAQKHGRAAARVKSAKAKVIAERQTARVERSRLSANKAIRNAKKRVDTLKAAYEALHQKASFSENSLKRNEALLNAAEQECKDLAKQGLDVPAPGDTSDWAYSAPTAWHPKEVMAAKARHEAKQAMVKAKEAWEKVNAPAAAKKELWLAAQAKLDTAKQKRKAVDEPSK